MSKSEKPKVRTPDFHMVKTVQPGEIDELDHVSNQVYLAWILEAAVAHSDAVGYDQAKYDELGLAFVVRRHEVDYLKPAVLGDTIDIKTWVESWSSVTSLRQTRISRDGVLLAKGVTTWVLINRSNGRPKRVPQTMVTDFLKDPQPDAE